MKPVRLFIATIAGLFLSVGSSNSQTNETARPTAGDANPTFIQRPSGEDFIQFYPPAALTQSVVGGATLDCTVNLDTTISCNIHEEHPEGWGFGEAALAASRAFRAAPKVTNGQAVAGGRMRVPIKFMTTLDRTPPEADLPAEMVEYMRRNPWPETPLWSDAPNGDDVEAAYPAVARRLGKRGRGVLSCLINADRTLSCQVSGETPANLGFGRAALALSRKFTVDESDTEFAERHRIEPFQLPINFGATPLNEPVSQTYDSRLPLLMPPPPQAFVEQIFPSRARAANISGYVTILCTVSTAPPATCSVQTETPSGWGFGESALTAVRSLPIRPSDDGILEGDNVLFHIPFARGIAAQ